MDNKQRERHRKTWDDKLAAQLNRCPVCGRGSVQATRDREDGGQEGACEKRKPFVYLGRDSDSEPWRQAPVEPDE